MITSGKFLMPARWSPRSEMEKVETVEISEMQRVHNEGDREFIRRDLMRKSLLMIEYMRWKMIVTGKLQGSKADGSPGPLFEADHKPTTRKQVAAALKELKEAKDLGETADELRIYVTSAGHREHERILLELAVAVETEVIVYDNGFMDKGTPRKFIPDSKIVVVEGVEPIGQIRYCGLDHRSSENHETGDRYTEVTAQVRPEITSKGITVLG